MTEADQMRVYEGDRSLDDHSHRFVNRQHRPRLRVAAIEVAAGLYIPQSPIGCI